MKLKTKYNLPEEIIYCSRCVMTNQRPSSLPEYFHKPDREGAHYLNMEKDSKGNYICEACIAHERKIKINWKSREKELLKLLDKHRSKKGEYDCIVPGSGGKDSVYASHILKYKYGMNPLTVTWPPIMYTDYGYKNFKNWIDIGGFDNISFNQNGRIKKLLTKLSVENLLHPFQSFVLGQKSIGPKIALKYKIPLIFYGESEAEYGNPIKELSSQRDTYYWSVKKNEKLYLAGIPVKKLMKDHNLKLGDIDSYLPIKNEDLKTSKMEVHYLGYYLKWVPQEAYYYAVEHAKFKPRPFRTQGTYQKYNSIDDKVDDLHYYTTYIKFGYGRASHDAAQEIRNKHLSRDEGIKLIKRFDGEYPDKYINDILQYLDISEEKFNKLCDKFRSPHIWRKTSNGWELKKPIY